MIYQLHWQDRSTPYRTVFVAQTEDVADRDGFERAQAELGKIIDQRRSECPVGWWPMICNEKSGSFIRTPEGVSP